MNQPKTLAADHKDPAFTIGDDRLRRLTDPTVAVAITINLDIKLGARTTSASAPLHEVPLLRRLYTSLGGTCTPKPEWVPGIRRRSKLSHLQLQDELKRLSEKYVIPAEGGKRDIMAEVYGATGALRLQSLRDKMVQAGQLWAELETRAMGAIRAEGLVYHKLEVEGLIADRINEKDMERIVRALDPEEVTADTIELEGIEGDEILEPAIGLSEAGQHHAAEQAAGIAAAGMTMDEMFGTEGHPGDTAEPAELTDVDLLIADLRQDGIEESRAQEAAVVITTYAGDKDQVREQLEQRGFKGKPLAQLVKRSVEYAAATQDPR